MRLEEVMAYQVVWSYMDYKCEFYQLQDHVDGLEQNCSISIAIALEILQSCTKPSMWSENNCIWYHTAPLTQFLCP